MKIIFESQKTDKKNQRAFHHGTNHPTLCPIKIWANIITRILTIPRSSIQSTINTVLLPDSNIQHLSNNCLLAKLRLAATILGPEILGFMTSEIGLHSLCSSAAMAMYMARIPVPMTKLTEMDGQAMHS
jgi:hypothetical protein